MSSERKKNLKNYLEEAEERLDRIDSCLEELTQTKGMDMETVHSIFRHTHSLKSGANLLGMIHVEKLAHRLEDILEMVRNGAMVPDARLVAVMAAGYNRIGFFLKNRHLLQLIDINQEIIEIDKHLEILAGRK